MALWNLNTSQKIFISHAWDDRPIVCRLEKELSNLGFEVWVDQSDIQPGDLISTHVSMALGECSILLLVWSIAASKSKWVAKEWSAANSNHKKIVPCLLDDTMLPPLLRDCAHVDLRDFEHGISYLQKTLSLPRAEFSVPVLKKEIDEETRNDPAVRNEITQIELRIGREFESYSDTDKENLMRAIRELLAIKEDIKIIKKTRGSVLLTLELPLDKTEKLLLAINSGKLSQHDVVDANFRSDRKEEMAFRWKNFLSEKLMFFELETKSMQETFRSMVNRMAHQQAITNPEVFLNEVISRETIEPTIVGRGIAFPHIRTLAVSRPVIALGRTRQSIPFISGKPDLAGEIQLILMMGTPKDDSNTYLQILARLCRLLRRTDFRDRLLAATTPDEIMKLFNESSSS